MQWIVLWWQELTMTYSNVIFALLIQSLIDPPCSHDNIHNSNDCLLDSCNDDHHSGDNIASSWWVCRLVHIPVLILDSVFWGENTYFGGDLVCVFHFFHDFGDFLGGGLRILGGSHQKIHGINTVHIRLLYHVCIGWPDVPFIQPLYLFTFFSKWPSAWRTWSTAESVALWVPSSGHYSRKNCSNK